MVQGKAKLTGQASLSGKSRPKGKAITQRKAAPAIVHRRDRTSAAINRRNEQLMAGRLAHDGGTLAVVPRPASVAHYDGSRAATSVRQHRQLQQSNMARHARMKRDGMAVAERGKRDKQSAEAAAGAKRKRGLGGVRQVGEEWFDERDAELEAMVYESEHSSDDDDDDAREGGQDDHDDGETDGTADTAEREEKTEPETAAAPADARPESQGKAVGVTQLTKGETKAAVKGQPAAVVAADEEDEDGGARATKRAKALLGGWFAQRDSKR